MTLDEAIELYEERSKDTWNGHQTRDGEICQQMAEWLKELKLYRMNGTVAQIDGKLYVAENPKLKTVHGKTGEVVIGGFKEVDNGN